MADKSRAAPEPAPARRSWRSGARRRRGRGRRRRARGAAPRTSGCESWTRRRKRRRSGGRIPRNRRSAGSLLDLLEGGLEIRRHPAEVGGGEGGGGEGGGGEGGGERAAAADAAAEELRAHARGATKGQGGRREGEVFRSESREGGGGGAS